MSASLSCKQFAADTSAYLDGALTGHEHLAMAAHIDHCAACAADFDSIRDLQRSLASLGKHAAPPNLQARLRLALIDESERGTHLPWHRRLAAEWTATLAPLVGRLAAATVATLLLIAGLAATTMAGHAPVEANDEPLGAVTSAHYLYSEVPPQAISFGAEAPVLVEAKVGRDGRVYDYDIVSGPVEPAIERRVQENLLSSVFRPATLFGVPVSGRVVITYSGISVRG